MTIKFEVNGHKMWIAKSVDGCRWISANGSMGKLCPSELAAQQNAITVIQNLIDQENSVYTMQDYLDDKCKREREPYDA